jgi:dihydrofolate reductase
MRRLIESTFVTLDGVISAPQEWGPPYWDEEHEGYANRMLSSAGALLMGRATYDVFSVAWPQRAGDAYADRLNALPKYVASRTLDAATWNTTVLGPDVAGEIEKLKQEPGGDILKFGTGELDRTLIEHGLIDEFHFWVFPVVAGAGDRLLEGIGLTHLRLIDTSVLRSGIVVHVCAPT